MQSKQLRIFDVVELKDDTKGIVKDIKNRKIKVEIIAQNRYKNENTRNRHRWY